MLFGTGLGSRLPDSWRKRIHQILSPHAEAHRRARLRKPSRPLSPRVQQVTAPPKRYATDSVSVIATNSLYLNERSDLGASENIYISLTTTPIRARSPEFLRVLDSLVAQRRKAKKVYLALPIIYKRAFAVEWETERPLFVDAIEKKYGNQIEIIDCEDNGPATKLLGLINYAAKNRFLKSNSIIVVVDDDIIYSDDLVRLHELCRDLYQCDVGIVDQTDVIESWIPLKFTGHNSFFSDNEKCNVYGWLSYSIKYDQTKDLPEFFAETVTRIPDAFFHDDAIFSAYIAKQGLYTTHINAAPLNPLSRTDLDGAKGGALRTETASHGKVRSQVEKNLGEFVSDPAGNAATRFHVPPCIPPRSVRNCSNLVFCNHDRRINLTANYLTDHQIIITITVFARGLIGKDTEIEFNLSMDFFRIPVRLESQKFSIVVEAYRPLFEPLSDHAELPIIQTNNTLIVSRNKFYSICTIMNNAPTHAYLFFDDEACIKYIERHFSEIVQKAYQSLIPWAYRADVFRYLFAYLNECIYFDVKMVLNVPISAVYHLVQDDQVFVADMNPDHIYNAFFINRRIKSQVFKRAIVLCLDRIISNDYSDGSLSVTGPGVLGLAKFRDRTFSPKLFKVFENDDWQNSTIRDQAGTEIAHCSYPDYYKENNYLEKYHYGILWNQRQVFRFPPSDFMKNSDRILKGVDHVLWINLERANERRLKMENILDWISWLPRTRIEAIDGRNALPWAKGSDIDANALDDEMACCLSHLKALDCALNLKGEYFLILEDDINFRFFPFHDSRDNLEKIMERAPRDWEVILISWIYDRELHREFTDWNRSFDDGFHIAGTGAYLVNRAALIKIHRLFEIRDGKVYVKKSDDHRSLLQDKNKWLVSDFFIYSNLKSYVYRNRIFATQNEESFIHPDHIDWHKQTQNITFNHIGDEIILCSVYNARADG
jgi:GR25 family glycosyltransferase involved in LPS biosynthesis